MSRTGRAPRCGGWMAVTSRRSGAARPRPRVSSSCTAAPTKAAGAIARKERSGLAGDIAAQPFAARLGPHLGELVEALEAARPGGQLEPRQLAAGEDVDVRGERFGPVERPGAQQHRVARRRMV